MPKPQHPEPAISRSPRGVKPLATRGPLVEITYCRLCGWGLRAGWTAQELSTTFAEEVGSVILTPMRQAAFEVGVDGEIVWSREDQARSPDIRELKQLVRDRIAP